MTALGGAGAQLLQLAEPAFMLNSLYNKLSWQQCFWMVCVHGHAYRPPYTSVALDHPIHEWHGMPCEDVIRQ